MAPTRAVSSAAERKTATGRAPTAIRTANSRVRRATRYDVTPWTPMADSAKARAANNQTSSALSRARATMSERMASIVLRVVDAEVAVHGPDLAPDGVRDAGRGLLRAHDQAHQAGRVLALREIDDRHDRLLDLMLAEVAHDPHHREPVGPFLGDCRPTGSAPGQYRAAAASLTTVTAAPSGRSLFQDNHTSESACAPRRQGSAAPTRCAGYRP